MNRRDTIIALVALGTTPLASFAQQQRKVPQIGFLIAETIYGQAWRVEALRAGLRDHGYVEGKNIGIEIRSADGNYDQLPELAAEFVRLKVDVLVAFGAKAVFAAKRATTTIPIVVPLVGDPVASGLVASLARPGGNITGSAIFGQEVGAKRVQLLKEAIPRINRVAVLMNPANASSETILQAMRAAAKSLQIELQPFEVRTPKEFGKTFSALAKARVNAIIVLQDTLFGAYAKQIAELAAKERLPSRGNPEFAEAGGLIGYGTNDVELHRRAAYFVDRILKGANPSDLPIERATRFEMVINLRTANAIGIQVPDSIRLRADRVIE